MGCSCSFCLLLVSFVQFHLQQPAWSTFSLSQLSSYLSSVQYLFPWVDLPVRHLKNINPGLDHSYFFRLKIQQIVWSWSSRIRIVTNSNNITSLGCFLTISSLCFFCGGINIASLICLWSTGSWPGSVIAGHAEYTATRLLSDDKWISQSAGIPIEKAVAALTSVCLVCYNLIGFQVKMKCNTTTNDQLKTHTQTHVLPQHCLIYYVWNLLTV